VYIERMSFANCDSNCSNIISLQPVAPHEHDGWGDAGHGQIFDNTRTEPYAIPRLPGPRNDVTRNDMT